MGYQTSKAYQTTDRFIIDIRSLSISIWKKPGLWVWHRFSWRWICAGPVEIMLRLDVSALDATPEME
jgi:hypothetical protein